MCLDSSMLISLYTLWSLKCKGANISTQILNFMARYNALCEQIYLPVSCPVSATGPYYIICQSVPYNQWLSGKRLNSLIFTLLPKQGHAICRFLTPILLWFPFSICMLYKIETIIFSSLDRTCNRTHTIWALITVSHSPVLTRFPCTHLSVSICLFSLVLQVDCKLCGAGNVFLFSGAQLAQWYPWLGIHRCHGKTTNTNNPVIFQPLLSVSTCVLSLLSAGSISECLWDYCQFGQSDKMFEDKKYWQYNSLPAFPCYNILRL